MAGGLGNDVLTVTRDGTTGSVDQALGTIEVDLSGGAGTDTLTVDLGGNSYRPTGGGWLLLRADGVAGNDVLACTLEAAATSAPPSRSP